MPTSIAVAGILLVMAGCGGGDSGPAFVELEADPSFPGEPGDPFQYQSLFDFVPHPECEPRNREDLVLSGELRIFRGEGVSDGTVQKMLRALQRYYAWYGVDFYTRHEVIDLPMQHALTFRRRDVRSFVLAETGLDIEGLLTAAEIARADESIGRAVLFNVARFVAVYGTPASDVVNVVVLPRIIDDADTGEELFGGTVVGIGLSPALLRQADFELYSDLFYLSGIPADFTPIAVVGARAIDRLLELPDAVVAHEVGHAYGLVHSEGFNNLLSHSNGCDSSLNDSQLDQVQASIEGTAGVDARIVSLSNDPGRLAAAIRSLVLPP